MSLLTRRSVAAFTIVGLAVTVLLVLLVAPHASSKPDGLQRIAADQQIDAHVANRSSAIHRITVSTTIGGLIGVVFVFAAAFVLTKTLARSCRPTLDGEAS